jgi:ubiquinone biosynthesis protein
MLAAAARRSSWVAGEPGLAESVAIWEAARGTARERLSDTAVALARPGPISPGRALRHATAAGLSRMIRIPSRLPTDLRDLTPLRQTDRWARETGAEAFADQLALGGAATAEVARLIVSARGLFPSDLIDELRRRPIEPPELSLAVAERVVERIFPEVDVLEVPAVASLPTSQLHAARCRDRRRVGVRIRRPGVARQVAADARLTASMVAPMSQVLPQLGGMGPIGFVQLTTRQSLEAVDLRYEALNLVEFGLIAEAAGIDGLTVTRPLPDRADQRGLMIDLPLGRSLAERRPDPAVALRALIGLTLEPALTHGVFWADPAPEHLLATDDGGLALVGVGSAGHLSPQLRNAGIKFLTSIVTGDSAGQIEAMRMADAVPPDADLDALAADLSSAESLQVSAILAGGEAGLLAGLRDATRILLAHRLEPPLDVIMLLRTVFALGDAIDRIAPGSGGLMAGLLPLFQRLPDLLSSANPEE